jgi:YidC/Oxa1 family membrane protein insertase
MSQILSPIENLLESLLKWFHEGPLSLTWAWSIVALVILVRILLVPITVRQIHSMQNLQAHAPEMKRIQEQWKHDRQRQNEELMKFYKENKINPASSCLPILIQIPIFISLFFVLKDAEDTLFKGLDESQLSFLGLVDITEKLTVGWGPLLIVVYALSQLTSSYFMSTTAPKSQRILIMVLPIVFIPFIINFPAGLMVYWLTSNLWTTGQGLVTRSLRVKPEELAAIKKSSRTPSKEELAAEAEAEAARSSADGKSAKPKPLPSSSGTTAPAGPPRRVKRKRSSGHGRR